MAGGIYPAHIVAIGDGQTKINPHSFWTSSLVPIAFALPPLTPVGIGNAVYGPSVIGPLTGTIDPLFARAIWRTPIFDLRPELNAASSYLPEASPVNRSGVYGAGARLTLETRGLDSISSAIRVYSVELGGVSDPRQMLAMNQRLDVTSHFFDPIPTGQGAPPQRPGLPGLITGSSMMVWEPPANPLRYWQVAVIFEVLAPPVGVLPRFTCCGELT
jgi:hypothetical protein